MRGEHALITGGAAGIGLELAKACLHRGATVSIVDLTRNTTAAAEELGKAVTLHDTTSAFFFYRADVGNFAEVRAPLPMCMLSLGNHVAEEARYLARLCPPSRPACRDSRDAALGVAACTVLC